MKIFKLIGKIVLAILALIVLIIVGTTIWNLVLTAQETQEYADYGQRVLIDSKSMNTLVLGAGEPTIVMLSGMGTLCPIADFGPLAKQLSNTNRVVILEYYGYGFSDDTDSERSSENITNEVRQALTELKIAPPYVLMPHSISGIYALDFAIRYPEEVAGIVGIDPSVAGQVQDQLVVGEATRIVSDITDVIGLTRILLTEDFPLLAEMKASGNYSEAEIAASQAACIRKSVSKADINEINMTGENLEEIKGQQYPKDLPVLNFLSHDSEDVYDKMISPDQLGWLALHEEMITDPEIQKNVLLEGAHYLHWTNVDAIAEDTVAFLNKNVSTK